QTFTSTSPASKPIRCTRCSTRSVATPELFFGHAIQSIPFAVSLAASFAKSRANACSVETNKRIMSSDFVVRFTNSTLSGSPSNSDSKSCGALTSAIRDPSLIPSFFAKGVPEYPAMLLSPESENFPPGESHQTPDADRYQRRNQAEGPP